MVTKANWNFSEDVGLECEASNLSKHKFGILFSLLCKSDIYFYNLAVSGCLKTCMRLMGNLPGMRVQNCFYSDS